MELRRTANAGVLLKLDGVTILMDGVCREVSPYPATPPEMKAELLAAMPDVVAFTHAHKDHYDPVFAAEALGKNGVIFGPAACRGTMEPGGAGEVRITPIKTRHIGAAGKNTEHASFILEGSRCIWFVGDASPSQWGRRSLPKPHVLIVPYAYCITQSAWESAKALGAETIVLLHMPEPEKDSIGLWPAVRKTVGEDPCLFIPAINETVEIPILCH